MTSRYAETLLQMQRAELEDMIPSVIDTLQAHKSPATLWLEENSKAIDRAYEEMIAEQEAADE